MRSRAFIREGVVEVPPGKSSNALVARARIDVKPRVLCDLFVEQSVVKPSKSPAVSAIAKRITLEKTQNRVVKAEQHQPARQSDAADQRDPRPIAVLLVDLGERLNTPATLPSPTFLLSRPL